jgi:GT2 family glycosyltransferase
MSSPVSCDLVIPVCNALRETRNCLESVARFAPPWARVVVVNDGSDVRTTAWLREREGITLLENPVNLGFVKAANRGLLFSDAPYVCLLNSDTLLTEGALERMVARLEKDPSIGLCCPLSNEAINLSVKLPPGENVFSFAERVAATSPARYPDAVTIVGFCLLFRRKLIETLGVFDEAFGRGYCEETDYHYRARAAGWRCAVADDAFVYHRRGASFRDGDARMWANMNLLMRRWKAVHDIELKEFDRRDDLGAVRERATREWTLPDARPSPPHDVLFVLPMMGVFGGVADVLELTNALVLLGVKAGVVVLDALPREMEMELFFRPLRIAPGRLLDDLPQTRLLVATSYQTVAPVAAAAAARPDTRTAYFVQDYEGWFGGHGPEYVARTYDLIPRLTAISTWLAKEIETRHGYGPAVVPMSADPELFYPRGDRSSSPPWRVVAMLRPDERRGARYLLPALVSLSRRPDVEVVLFGAHPVPPGVPPFPHRHAGVLSRDEVAGLLSTAHVVVDPSLFQGFGLVGLEGMASGAACVLTESGGIQEYAEDGVNALVVPVRDEKALARAIERLLDDRALRERLAAAGVATARRFTWKGAAERFLEFARALPPPEPATEREKAALFLLWEEVCQERGREEALRGEIAALSDRLHGIYRSTVWRFANLYWKLKARVRPD